MKPVDHVGQADGQADVDDLLLGEVIFERGIGRRIDRIEAGRLLRIGDDGRLGRLVDVRRQRIVEQVLNFCF